MPQQTEDEVIKMMESIVQEQLPACEQIENDLQSSEWFKSRPEHVQALIKEWPQWGFYQYKDSKAPVRIWGVGELPEKDEHGNSKLVFHACCAHLGWVNETIGGISPEYLERVDRWSEDQLKLIYLNSKTICDAFVQPVGFTYFISQYNRHN